MTANSDTAKASTPKKAARRVLVNGIDVTDRVVDFSIRPGRLVVACLDEDNHSDWQRTDGKKHSAPDADGPCLLAVRGGVYTGS